MSRHLSGRLALVAALAAVAAAGTGCRRNMTVRYDVDEDVDLTALARIEVLIEGTDGTFDVLDAEMSISPLGAQVIADPVANTILLVMDLTLVAPDSVRGLELHLRTPGGKPPVRFTPTLVPAAGVPLANLVEATPAEVEYAPGELVVIHLSAAGGPLDAAVDAGTDAGGTDAAPTTDAGPPPSDAGPGIDSGT